MSEGLPDDVKRVSGVYGKARKSVAKIMQPHVGDPGLFPDLVPNLLKADQVPVRLERRKDPVTTL